MNEWKLKNFSTLFLFPSYIQIQTIIIDSLISVVWHLIGLYSWVWWQQKENFQRLFSQGALHGKFTLGVMLWRLLKNVLSYPETLWICQECMHIWMETEFVKNLNLWAEFWILFLNFLNIELWMSTFDIHLVTFIWLT